LDLVTQGVPQIEKLFVGSNLNGHIGAKTNGHVMAHGCFGYRERNNARISILNFVVAYDLMIVNSYFKKKDDHLVTFKSGTTKTQIDYFLIRANNRGLCKDCKVLPSEYLGTQHSLLVMDVEFKFLKRKKISVGNPRVKWWNSSEVTQGSYQRRC